MSTILTNYPIFERNQVLTSGQLNQMVDYLDQQNRLTRAKLIGMGVACGLELTHTSDGGGSNVTLTISRGSGITSEGYLANLGDCITERYRPYTLPAGLVYEPFVDPVSKLQDITLHELLTEKAVAGPDDLPLESPGGFLDDKVVLLFVECFDKDLKSCLGKSCDELGKDRLLTMRKLLINKTDLAKVNARTASGKLDALYPEKFDLPQLSLPRPLFNPTEDHVREYDDFCREYADDVASIYASLFSALEATYDIYRPLLIESYEEDNPFTTASMLAKKSGWLEYLNGDSSPGPKYFGIQYFYDFARDLIQAYHEFQGSAFDLLSDCCPDMSRFPKHLMLGEAMGTDGGLCSQNDFRHEFVQPPIYNHQGRLVQEVVSLHNRLVLMLESFDLNRIATGDGEARVQVTPSQWRGPLADRAIPWYYDVEATSDFGPLGTLPDYWNFDVSRRCVDENAGRVLSYQKQSTDQSVADTPLTTPLHYDISSKSFFRIEGHVGKDYQTAWEDIAALRDQFNLPFDVVTVQLDGTLPELLQSNCHFHELASQYLALREQWTCELEVAKSYWQDVVNNSEPEEVLLPNERNAIDQLLSDLDDFLDWVPDDLDAFVAGDFASDFVPLYTAWVNAANALQGTLHGRFNELLRSLNPAFSAELLASLQHLFRDYGASLDRLITRCHHEPLAVLYAYHNYLSETLLADDLHLFSNFLAKHPGIDHQGGVNRGGTFVLLKNNNGSDALASSTVIADFYLPYACCDLDGCGEIAVPESSDLTIPAIPLPGYQSFEIEPFLFAVDTFASLKDKTATSLLAVDVIPQLIFDRNKATDDKVILGLVDTNESKVLSPKPVNNPGDSLPASIIEVDGALELDHGWAATAWQANRQVVLFEPYPDFVGFEKIHYVFGFEEELKERSTMGSVTAHINCCGQVVAPPSTTCYTRDILLCWGDAPVRLALKDRGISAGATPVENADLLLADLANSKGFTLEEIESRVLEDEDLRRGLLSCLGIDHSSLKYEELATEIFNYQSVNCGGSPPVASCYTAEQLQCWGDPLVKQTLEFREIQSSGTSADAAVLLADSLRNSGGFTTGELADIMKDVDVRRQLLSCVNVPFGDANFQELGQLILNYQVSNCGGSAGGGNNNNGGVVVTGDDVFVNFDPASLSISEMKKLAKVRGLPTGGNDPTAFRNSLEGSSGGTRISKEEAGLLNKATITQLLEANNVEFTPSATKNDLIETLFTK